MTVTPAGLAAVPHVGFGDRLRRIRLELGMDQRTFAGELGVTNPTLSRYETASGAPRAAALVAAAVQLRFGSADVDLKTWLITGRGTQPTDQVFPQVTELRRVA